MKPIIRNVSVLAVGALLALGGCDRIEKKMIQRAASRNLAADHTELLTDGSLHVILCGTGSPLADRERADACTAVIAGNHFILVDIGNASWRQVALGRLPRANLDAILLTHFHSDHIGDLGEAVMQSWVSGRTKPLVVYGPTGVERVVDGFKEAYALDTGYRIAHHGPALVPEAGVAVARPLVTPEDGQSIVVFSADGLTVTAFTVDHAPVAPAFGYRFDYQGRSVVISGDTKKSANLAKFAKGADVLIHEALARHMIEAVSEYADEQGLTRWAKLSRDIVNYHTTPVEAAEVARDASVKLLVFTHVVPPLPNFIARRIFLRGVSDTWSGHVEIGYDLMHITLPPASSEVKIASMG